MKVAATLAKGAWKDRNGIDMYISQPTQSCPICNRPVEPSQRYPRYACEDCVSKAKSIEGRPLLFSNEGFSGGFVAEYADTGVSYTGNEWYIDRIKCRADEHRFGGIVVQPL